MTTLDSASATHDDLRTLSRFDLVGDEHLLGNGVESPGLTTTSPLSLEHLAELRTSTRLLACILDMQTREILRLLSKISHPPAHSVRIEGVNLDTRAGSPASASPVNRAPTQLIDLLDEMPFLATRGDGNLAHDVQPGSVSKLAAIVRQAIEPLTHLRGVHVAIEVLAAADTLACDHVGMMQVIAALLLGAVRRTPAMGSVRFVATRQGKATRLAVQDEGAHLTPDEVAEFLRQKSAADPAWTPHQMSVARDHIELHGGRLESRKGDPTGMVFDAVFDAGPTHD